MVPPIDVVITPHRAGISDAGVETILWGGWHRVPSDPGIRATLDRASVLDREGRLEDAIRVLQHGLVYAPHSWILLECRGALHAASGFWRAAERDFARSIQIGPGRAETWLALGCVRRELGLSHGSERALTEAKRKGISGKEIDWVMARSKAGRQPDRP